jgi:hypothetical protein
MYKRTSEYRDVQLGRPLSFPLTRNGTQSAGIYFLHRDIRQPLSEFVYPLNPSAFNYLHSFQDSHYFVIEHADSLVTYDLRHLSRTPLNETTVNSTANIMTLPSEQVVTLFGGRVRIYDASTGIVKKKFSVAWYLDQMRQTPCNSLLFCSCKGIAYEYPIY